MTRASKFIVPSVEKLLLLEEVLYHTWRNMSNENCLSGLFRSFFVHVEAWSWGIDGENCLDLWLRGQEVLHVLFKQGRAMLLTWLEMRSEQLLTWSVMASLSFMTISARSHPWASAIDKSAKRRTRVWVIAICKTSLLMINYKVASIISQ